MRYKHDGNVHKDFHLATQTTIDYVLKTYGMPFLEELFRRTAQEVYREIYTTLKRGDVEPLLEHWSYYYDREDGTYRIERRGDDVDFVVSDCPAVRHVLERQDRVDDSFYLQFDLLCQGFSESTPFDITCRRTGEGSYVFEIRNRI